MSAFRQKVVMAAYDAFGAALDELRVNDLEALVAAYSFFRDLERSLTPAQYENFQERKREIEDLANAFQQGGLQ
jgi:hypothetical protein